MFVVTSNIAVNILKHPSFHSCVPNMKNWTLKSQFCVGALFSTLRVCYAILTFIYPTNPSLCYLRDHALFFPFDTYLSETLSTKCFWQDNL